MILNAIDEVLFWDDIDVLKEFTKQNNERFYPHDYEGYYESKKAFFKSVIPSKAAFIHRLERYAEAGKPIWISGRNELSDDIDSNTMIKAISVNSKKSNGEQKAEQASKYQARQPSFWNFYTNNILHYKENRILELTIGAGGGTSAVMKNMKSNDYYMGVDIDFTCTKNADALADHYSVNGLGIATSLWKLPFDDEMFTSVCSNARLEECREIPTIIKEAYRVLTTGGKFILHCLNANKMQSHSVFEQYGFSYEEMMYWLKKVRSYSDPEDTENLLSAVGFKFKDKMLDKSLGCILVYEK